MNKSDDQTKYLRSLVRCRMRIIPFASISNVTSIWGTPRGAGGIPLSSNFPRRLLSFVRDRSPSKTWINTVCWLSAAVEKLYRLQLVHEHVRRSTWYSHLALAGRDNGVTRDEFRHYTAGSLDTQCQWTNIDKDDVAQVQVLVSREDTTLDSSTVRDGIIRVNTLRGFLAGVLLQELLYLRNTG